MPSLELQKWEASIGEGPSDLQAAMAHLHGLGDLAGGVPRDRERRGGPVPWLCKGEASSRAPDRGTNGVMLPRDISSPLVLARLPGARVSLALPGYIPSNPIQAEGRIRGRYDQSPARPTRGAPLLTPSTCSPLDNALLEGNQRGSVLRFQIERA
jgi:hypothetical protein